MPEKAPKKSSGQYSQMTHPMVAAGSAVLAVIAGGTVVYHFLEEWTWIQSFYFSVVSMTTVGYGDLAPTSDASRLFTALYLLTGAGVVLSALGVIGSRYLELREERRMKRRERKSGGANAS